MTHHFIRAIMSKLEGKLKSSKPDHIVAWLGNFRPQSPCVYRTDFPWYLLVLPARALEIIGHNRGSDKGPATKIPDASLRSISVVWLLLVAVPVLFGAWFAKVLFGDKVDRPFLTDWSFQTLYVIFLASVLLAFNFYSTIFPTFNKLEQSGCLKGSSSVHFQQFLVKLEERCNWWGVIPVWIAVAAVTTVGLMSFPETTSWWMNELSISLRSYYLAWSFMAYFSLLFFAWKVIVVGISIREISLQHQGLIWAPEHSSRDDSGGLLPLGSLWFRVHLLVVLVGIYVYGWAIFSGVFSQFPNLIGIMTIIAMVAYVLLAPVLFFGPLVSVHRVMAAWKENAVQEAQAHLNTARKQLNESRPDSTSISRAELYLEVQHWHDDLARREKLPAWPLNTRIFRLFLGSYLLLIFLGGFLYYVWYIEVPLGSHLLPIFLGIISGLITLGISKLLP